jgi:glutamyl-tRNA synthetase
MLDRADGLLLADFHACGDRLTPLSPTPLVDAGKPLVTASRLIFVTQPGIRLRFAPSPTGMFHVGNARTVLFNWVYARQSGATLVLRIEDTDAARNRPEWVQGILDAMAWLGIGPDEYEGPLMQSAYAAEHRTAVARLLADGWAYYCDCTRDEVVARTGSEHKGYDGFCRARSLTAGDGRAVRFRTPDEGVTTIVDLVRGKPTFDNALIEDFVIARGDGSPVFLLANVVDDIAMGITHVVRAEDHLPNTPKQQLLWEALGAQRAPVWAHAPILVNEKRQKLSKRRDRVALEDFRAEGYLPEAMRNYLMLLGWAPAGDREIVPWSDILTEFRQEEVNPSPAFFDVRKLRAFNGEYIRAMPLDQFVQACQPWLRPVRARPRRAGGLRQPDRPAGTDRWPARTAHGPGDLATAGPVPHRRLRRLRRRRTRRPGRHPDRHRHHRPGPQAVPAAAQLRRLATARLRPDPQTHHPARHRHRTAGLHDKPETPAAGARSRRRLIRRGDRAAGAREV